MEEEQQLRRRRRVKKKSPFKGILLMLVIAVIAAGIYAAIQFQSGKKLAEDSGLPSVEFTGDPSNGKFENILVLGIDTREEEKSRTDTMILMTHDKEADELKLTSFMRDIYADIPGYQSYKLNTAYYLGGANLLADTLRNMFGVEIQHYALIDFKNFEQMADIAAPDGVEIDVKKEMSEKIGVTLKPGLQKLNGKELLGYARFRADADSDFGRVKRQQEVIIAMKEKLASVSAIPRYPKLAGAAQGYIQTDMPITEQMNLAIQLAINGADEVGRLSVPVEGSYSNATYSHAGSVLEIDLEQNRHALSEFLGQRLD